MKLKKLPFVIRYVPDQYKTEQMFDKAILENESLESVPDGHKNQAMCNKAVDNYPHALTFFPICYITQNMCDKAVNTHPTTTQFVSECFKTQEMCDKAVNRCFLHLILSLINIKLKKCLT